MKNNSFCLLFPIDLLICSHIIYNNGDIMANKAKLIYGIIGLCITLFLIYGGATGSLALRGTNNSQALVVVGFLLLIFDAYYLYTAIKE